MESLIELANKDLNECSDYYEMMNYFRHNSSPVSQALSNACSYELNNNSNNLNETLCCSILTKTISQDDIDLLDSIVNEIENEQLKARVYHFLFLNREKRCLDDAINTMSSYCNSVEKLLKNEDIYTALDNLFMIIYLGDTIRLHDKSYDLAKNKLIELLERFKSNNPIQAIQVLNIANRLSIKNNDYIFEISNFIADSLIGMSEEWQAILALEIAKSNISSNSRTELDKINRKIADCFISIARSCDGIAAAHYLLRAINTLAQIKGTREERLALYEEMRDCQIESILDLEYVETKPYDCSKILGETNDILNGCQDLFDMLFRIAFCICDIVEINELKESELELGKGFIDVFFSHRIYIDQQGINMVVGDVPSIIDFKDISKEDKQALWSKMVERMKIHHQISVFVIQEALRILNINYNVKYSDIVNICKNNPFIPLNHEEFFSKGIFAGIRGDFLTACHLLVPQVENSLRHLLELRAEEPTTLHNTEQERDGLKSLLENPQLIKIFGIDGIIHLRTVLIDKRYPGLRHSVAHGFIDYNHFYGTGAIYTWWLIFRIIMVSYKSYWEKTYMKTN